MEAIGLLTLLMFSVLFLNLSPLESVISLCSLSLSSTTDLPLAANPAMPTSLVETSGNWLREQLNAPILVFKLYVTIRINIIATIATQKTRRYIEVLILNLNLISKISYGRILNNFQNKNVLSKKWAEEGLIMRMAENGPK